MALVDHKTQNPGNDLYGYSFFEPPPDRTAAFPKGTTTDANILPVRDISGNWREIHGVDQWFVMEGALERLSAVGQFGNSSIRRYESQEWPTWKQESRVDGRLNPDGYYTHIQTIYNTFNSNWMTISSENQLSSEIYTWPTGQLISSSYTIPNGLPHQGETLFNYPNVLFGATEQGMCQSWGVRDWFNRNGPIQPLPLSAEPIREIYRDLEKLTWYIPLTRSISQTSSDSGIESGIQNYNTVLGAKSYNVDIGYTGYRPSVPEVSINTVLQQTRHRYASSENQNADYIFQEASAGTYCMPRCGKHLYGDRWEVLGDVSAVYALMYASWRYTQGAQTSAASWYAMVKVPFSINQTRQLVEVQPSDLAFAAHIVASHFGVDQPSEFLPAGTYRIQETNVAVQRLFQVCRLTDRTDTNQLNWNRRTP